MAALEVFATYAEASAALPSLAAGTYVEVMADENYADARTRYRVESGVLVFKANLDQLGVDLADGETGKGAWLSSYRPYGVNAPVIPVAQHLRDTLSTNDYQCAGDGITVDTAAFVAAIRAAEALFDQLNNSVGSMPGKVVLRVIGNILLDSTVTFNPAKVALMGPGKIIALPTGSYTDSRLFVLTDHDGAIASAAYSNKTWPVFSGMVFDGQNREDLDLLYAYASSTDPNNNPAALHTVYNCHFYRFRRIFTHGRGGWGWDWFGCGASACERWLYLTSADDTYERFAFLGCIFQNGGYAVECSNPNGKVYYQGGSIDYSTGIAILTSGYMEVNSHIEYRNRSVPLAKITVGQLKINGGLLAVLDDAAEHVLFEQAAAYQLNIEGLAILTNSVTTMGAISNLPYYSRGVRPATEGARKMLLRGPSRAAAGLLGFTVEPYGEGITFTQTDAAITLASANGAGGSKGILIWLPINEGAQLPYVGWSITVDASGSSNPIYLTKAVYSASKLDALAVAYGGELLSAGQSTTLTSTDLYRLADPGKRWLRLRLNCNQMGVGESAVISAISLINE